MSHEKIALDATMGCRDGLFTFCPIEDDGEEFNVITGMSYISATVPENKLLVAIVHADGQEAVESFCKEYAAELEALQCN